MLRQYSYDNAGQLTGVDYGQAHPYAGPGGGNLSLPAYDFDEVGNCPLPLVDDLRDGFAFNEPLIAAKQWKTETRDAVPAAYVAYNVNRYSSVGGVAPTAPDTRARRLGDGQDRIRLARRGMSCHTSTAQTHSRWFEAKDQVNLQTSFLLPGPGCP